MALNETRQVARLGFIACRGNPATIPPWPRCLESVRILL